MTTKKDENCNSSPLRLIFCRLTNKGYNLKKYMLSKLILIGGGNLQSNQLAEFQSSMNSLNMERISKTSSSAFSDSSGLLATRLETRKNPLP